MSNIKNLAVEYIAVAPTPATSGTSLEVSAGKGSFFSDVPFKATIGPEDEIANEDHAEIVLVTAISSDTLTIVRAQNGTSAKPIDVGWVIANGIYTEDVKGVDVTVATAAATVAKIGTTAAGNYVPAIGDVINVTFSSGSNVSAPTLNIDGSGAKNIRLGNVNATTAFIGTTSALTVKMWYDGTYWQLFGSLKNDNTTYSEISEAEAASTTSSTTRLITGRRLQTAISNAIAAITGFVKSSTTDRLTVSDTAPSSPATGDVWIDTNDLPEELAPTSIVWKETPGGTKNGTNTDFTTSQAYISGSLQLFKNGVAQSGMVSEDAPGSGQFSITPAPESDDDLSVQYQVRTTATGNADTLDGYHANATPTPNNIPVLDSNGKIPQKTINTRLAKVSRTSTFSTTAPIATPAEITDLAVTFTLTEAHTVKSTIYASSWFNSGANSYSRLTVYNGPITGTRINYGAYSTAVTNQEIPLTVITEIDLTPGTYTFTVSLSRNSGTANVFGSAEAPIIHTVDIVA